MSSKSDSEQISSTNVDVDTPALAGCVPRLDRATEVLPQAVGDSIGSGRSLNPVEFMQDLFSSPKMDKYFKLSVGEFLHLAGEAFHKAHKYKSKD